MKKDISKYAGVPGDFPCMPDVSALTGVQAKMNIVEEDGEYYQSGTSPSEILAAFDTCEDLSVQMQQYCKRKLDELKTTPDNMLELCYRSLLTKDWCTPAQALWTMRRTATSLGWEIPATLAWPQDWTTLMQLAAGASEK